MDGERRGGGVDAGKDCFGASSNKDGKNRAVKKILSTLGLKLPNLIISIDKTDGDSIEGEKGVQNLNTAPHLMTRRRFIQSRYPRRTASS